MKLLLPLVCVATVIAFVLGGTQNPTQFFHSYLYVYLVWFQITLGALGLSMIAPLTGGKWAESLQPLLLSANDLILAAAILFIPIVIGARHIYPWVNTAEAVLDPKYQHQLVYLNLPFFIVRAVIYFVSWFLLAHFLSGYAARGDAAKLRSLSGGGLVVYGFTISFASFDWIMSLEPHWYSTIYGMVFAVAIALSAFAFMLFFVTTLPLSLQSAPGKAPIDQGNILLATLVIWAYVSFMQYLIIWSGNLPEEAVWYLHRTAGGWSYFAGAIITAQFFGPFFYLLFRGLKRTPQTLAGVAFLIVIVRWADLFWFVTPAFNPTGPRLHWLDVAGLVAMGTLWLILFNVRVRRRLPIAGVTHG